ncbi:MAG: TonB-dependent receptor [candidate division Zixibacteria bacterium]|nr:TonB-dependent receptor [candidate division Zixibacteria bacterium]
MSIFFAFLSAGNLMSATLSGRVTATHNISPLGVTVSIPALHRFTETDSLGMFTLLNLPAGVYAVEFSSIALNRLVRTAALTDTETTLNVELSPSVLELPGISVTSTPQPTDALSSPQSVTVVSKRNLDRLRGESVMSTIKDLPGVATYSTGSSIVKPVIRGLSSQRVLVVSDGIRQEGQQWGDEHGPEIDALDVNSIEVVRGPSSVLYGSDALGGVINIINNKIPSVDEGAVVLGGNLLLNGFSGNKQSAGALSLSGANGQVGYRASVSLRDAGNITTPARELFNSAEEEMNGSGAIGLQGDWGSLSVGYIRFDQKLQIHEDPNEEPDATPNQHVEHDRAHLHTNILLNGLRVEAKAGWQRNQRREFEEAGGREPALNLNLETNTLDLEGHHRPFGKFVGTVGISLMDQTNRTLAEEKLIPGFDLANTSGFLFEQWIDDTFTASAGIRYDTRTIDVLETSEINVTEQRLEYDAVTGSIGIVWRLIEPLALVANAGRGWRSPTPFELFVDGVHEGTVRYEIGDITLNPEESFNVDLALRAASTRFSAEISIFRNRIAEYIFLSPTGETDTASGLSVYEHRQADATLVGGELSAQFALTNWLVLSGGFDMVRGTNTEIDRSLPLLPANRVKAGIKFLTTKLGGLYNPYFSVQLNSVARQDRVDEFETPSAGYELITVAGGTELMFGGNRITIDVGIENLFNVSYRDHLYRYKEYAQSPGMNVFAKVSVPFELIK